MLELFISPSYGCRQVWTSSAKIWYATEVAEVKIRASGGRGSGQGPGEKKFNKNS